MSKAAQWPAVIFMYASLPRPVKCASRSAASPRRDQSAPVTRTKRSDGEWQQAPHLRQSGGGLIMALCLPGTGPNDSTIVQTVTNGTEGSGEGRKWKTESVSDHSLRLCILA